jgi:hypothetical protein
MAALRFKPTSSPRFAALAFGLALLGAGSMAYYHLGLFITRAAHVLGAKDLAGGYSFGNDFYQIWLSSREWRLERRDPYSDEMTRRIQIGLYGRPLDPHRLTDPVDRRGFPYPAFAELLFWPAGEFPFATVCIVVFAVLVGLAFATPWLWMRATDWDPGWLWSFTITVLFICSYPILEGLYAGQVGLLVGFLLAASLLALQRGRLLLSGVLMALTTIKPQVTALAILYLAIWCVQEWPKRRAFLAGFLTTAVLLVGGALVVWPRWIQTWMQVVVRYHGYTMPPLTEEILRNLLGSRLDAPASLLLTVALIASAGVLAWLNRAAKCGSVEFWFTLSLLLAITTIGILPGQAVYDHGILLPGVFLLLSRWRELATNWVLRATLLIGVAVLVWPWMAATGVLLLRPLLSDQLFYSKPIFALPLRTAAVLPFVVLGLLVLGRRAAARIEPAQDNAESSTSRQELSPRSV